MTKSTIVLVMVNLRKADAKGRIRLPFLHDERQMLKLRDLHSAEIRERTREVWMSQGCVFKVRGGGARIWVDVETYSSLVANWTA
jgi:hypothetical protein